MSLGGYIVLGIIIAAVLIVYVMFVLTYLRNSKRYREADRITATITEDLGDMKVATGGITIGVPRYRKFYRYQVSFWLNGREYLEEAQLKNRNLNIGDSVEVRYEISEQGELNLRSEALLCWSREMAVGYTLGLVLGIVLSILKSQGII